jgi:small subunit ribosomal protein S17
MSETTATDEATELRGIRKVRVGTVTSASNDKTIVVRVDRKSQHERYKKVITRSKKYHTHDEENEARVGDTVRIRETRPMSKLKRWRLLEIIRRGE